MYYSGNRYLTLEEMKVNAQYIYEYLSAKGWSKNAVAGVLGNMQTESTINPAIWESLNEGNLSGGYGLVQWTPATKYLDWAAMNNMTPELMDSNLDRILYEVENNIQWGNDAFGSPPPYDFLTFTKSTAPAGDLAITFLRYYERPAVFYQPNRAVQAEFWYKFLRGKKKKTKVYMYIKPKRRYIIT